MIESPDYIMESPNAQEPKYRRGTQKSAVPDWSIKIKRCGQRVRSGLSMSYLQVTYMSVMLIKIIAIKENSFQYV